MYENVNFILDRVRTFEFYLNKLHPENPNLFAKASTTCMKEGVWYTRQVIGKNMLSTIMQTISRKAGLSTMYTNHCVRATTITSLFQAGVDSKRICSITKQE